MVGGDTNLGNQDTNLGEPDFSYQPSDDELSEQHQQWGKFIGNLAMQEKLISTYQLSLEGIQVDSQKNVSVGIPMGGNQIIGGNMIVRAGSIDEAAEISKDCPVLFTGGLVEIREILPME